MAIASTTHSSQTTTDMHTLIRWSSVDATARLALVLVAADLGKLCHQADDDSYWVLVDLTPTWYQVSVGITHHTAATAPGVGDDTADGYVVGTLWVDTALDNAYICCDVTAGAAVWKQVTP